MTRAFAAGVRMRPGAGVHRCGPGCCCRRQMGVVPTRHFSSNRDLIAEMKAGKPIIGDGGFVFELEKRGFVKAGPWTPEATCEFPNAVKQLHFEFARAGA